MPPSTSAVSKVTEADEAKSFNDYKDIEKAIQPYADAAKAGDGKLACSVFYEHAHIVGSIGGEFQNENVDAFEASVKSVGPAPDIEHRIVWIDVSGPAAAAKVEFFNWGGFRFTDFFVLFKNGGQWKVSGKVYDSHSHN